MPIADNRPQIQASKRFMVTPVEPQRARDCTRATSPRIGQAHAQIKRAVVNVCKNARGAGSPATYCVASPAPCARRRPKPAPPPRWAPEYGSAPRLHAPIREARAPPAPAHHPLPFSYQTLIASHQFRHGFCFQRGGASSRQASVVSLSALREPACRRKCCSTRSGTHGPRGPLARPSKVETPKPFGGV